LVAADGEPEGTTANGYPEALRDACGVGFLADLRGRPGRHLLPLGLGALARMAHRGAVDADGRTGDGAGVTTQIPFDVLRPELDGLGLAGAGPGHLAVGLVFLPWPEAAAAQARKLVAEGLGAHGLVAAGWRAVPVDDDVLGDKARACRPRIAHVFVPRPDGVSGEVFERRLYRARRTVDARAAAAGLHLLPAHLDLLLPLRFELGDDPPGVDDVGVLVGVPAQHVVQILLERLQPAVDLRHRDVLLGDGLGG